MTSVASVDVPPASVDVYRIITYDSTRGNAYGVNRDEDWVVRKVPETFDSLEAAQSFIRKMSIQHTDLVRFGHHLQGAERDRYIEAFCFEDDRYLKHRRYFVGPPPLRQIKLALQHDGIRVT